MPFCTWQFHSPGSCCLPFQVILLPEGEEAMVFRGILHQQHSTVKIVFTAAHIKAEAFAHIDGGPAMRVLPERSVKIPTGGQRSLHRIYFFQRAHHHRIGIYEKEIPFHILPHTGFQKAGALHGRKRRIQRSHHHLVKKGPESRILRPPLSEGSLCDSVCKKGYVGPGIAPAGRRNGHVRLLQIDILRGAYQYIQQFSLHFASVYS